MSEFTHANMIWNRACGKNPLRFLPGDRALADLLRAHGLAMNGGVLHVVECLTASELSDAQSGYRFCGLDAVASLLARAKKILQAGNNLKIHERQLDQQYADMIPADNSVVERFEKHLKLSPFEYAPVRVEDMA
jgi:hypothetical protein